MSQLCSPSKVAPRSWLWRLKRRDRKVHLTNELPDEWIKVVENAKVPDEYAYLDAQMD